MCYLYHPVAFSGQFQQGEALFYGPGDGFFLKYMVSGLEGGPGDLKMRPVGGGVHQSLGEPSFGRRFAEIGEASFFRDLVNGGKLFPPPGVGFDHGDEFQVLRISERKGPELHHAAAARSRQYRFDRNHLFFPPCCFQKRCVAMK